MGLRGGHFPLILTVILIFASTSLVNGQDSSNQTTPAITVSMVTSSNSSTNVTQVTTTPIVNASDTNSTDTSSSPNMTFSSVAPPENTTFDANQTAANTSTETQSTATATAPADTATTTPNSTTTATPATTTVNYCSGVNCNNGTCENSGTNYTCRCNPGWTGDSCTQEKNYCAPNPCQSGNCFNNLTAAPEYYTCVCPTGWMGTNCTEDVQECEASPRPCINGYCSERKGSYKCLCDLGWGGDNCSQDVDECNATENPCLSHSNSDCVNTIGSYTCSCKAGYAKMDNMCQKLVIYPNYDWDYSTKVMGVGNHKETVNTSIPFSYFQKSANKICFDSYGLAEIGDCYSASQIPSITGWPSAPSLFAIYWSNIELPPNDLTFFTLLKEDRRLRNLSAKSPFISYIKEAISDTNFEPLLAYAATWYKVFPYPAKNFTNDMATFQLILTTDSVVSYAIKGYQTVWENTNVYGRPTVTTYYSNENGTRTMGQDPGNAVGPIVVKLSNKQPNNSSYECVRKTQEANAQLLLINQSLPKCPCVKSQAVKDGWFELKDTTASCYSSILAYGGSLRQQCCYNRVGQLLSGSKDAKVPSQDPGSAGTTLQAAYDQCCNMAPQLCDWFYKQVPTSDCSGYKPPSVAAGFGNTHTVRFNSNKYTFNLWGDFVLLKVGDVEIQARTMKNNNTNTTSYQAFAVQVAENTSSFQIYPQGSVLMGTFSSGSSNPRNETFKIFQESSQSQITIVLPTVVFRVTYNESIISFSVQLKSGDAVVEGLLGSQVRVGFPPDSGSAQTWEKVVAFARSWQIQNANESLFNYPGQLSFDEANNHTDFVPEVLGITNETMYDMLKNDSETAKKLCNDELFCLQDYYISKDSMTAARAVDEVNKIAQIMSAAVPAPEFSNTETELYITNNSTQLFTLTLTVKGNMPVEFGILDEEFGNLTGINISGSTFTWNISTGLSELRAMSYKKNLRFYAVNEAKMSAIYAPTIQLCLCEQLSQCAFNSYFNNDGYEKGNVNNLQCNCGERFGGAFCEKMEDVCQNCYNNTNSTCDSSKEVNYCAACPIGFQGDGKICLDIDECASNNGGCNQKCTNQPGSFMCSCRDGYTVNGSNCVDINECDQPNICNNSLKICTNKPGTYSCSCLATFVGDNCIKAPYSYVGKVGLAPTGNQIWSSSLSDSSSESYKTLSKLLVQAILDALSSANIAPRDTLYIQVLSFSQSSTPVRQKRATDPPSNHTIAIFVVSSSEALTPEAINQALQNFTEAGCTTYCKFGDIEVFTAPPTVDTSNNLCNYPDVNKCDLETTTCMESNQQTSCPCKAGYTESPGYPYSCRDSDECTSNDTNSCPDGARCKNLPGSYECDCGTGKTWNMSSTSCVPDKCSPNPCKNSGVCFVSQDGQSFSCSCQDGWSGATCETEDDETNRLRVAVICVSVILGVLCLVLLIVVIVMCIRQRRSGSDWTLDNDSYTNARYHDTDNLPRAKISHRTGTDMAENGQGSYELLKTGRNEEMNTSFGHHSPTPATKNVHYNRAYEDDAGERL